MKKTRKNKIIYDEMITMDNLYNVWNIIRKTCKNKREVFYFSLNLNSNLMHIYKMLKNRCYVPSKYRPFMIFEPKPRLVMSQCITDKIVNHFVTNYYLIPLLDASLIDSNVATRKGKGTDYAFTLLKRYFNKIIINEHPSEIYALKIDISKYFYMVDHELLIDKLKSKIMDKDVIDLISIIISETNKDYINDIINKYNSLYGTNIPLYKNNKGLSIGAMSSQFLAIYYLCNIDHYIKEVLGCKYYIRYMDDFLILDTDKDRLKNTWKDIANKISNLKLLVNDKSNIYRSTNGFNFLGYNYKFVNNKLRIFYNKKTYYKMIRKLKYLKSNDLIMYNKSYASYYGYLKRIREIDKYNFKIDFNELYNLYKRKYEDYLIIIKDKINYKVIEDNNTYCLNNKEYTLLIDKLREIEIPLIVISKNRELLKCISSFWY